ncbi:thiol reductant ABC exporter subunit CydD [Sphingomonas echinoides]|uniref:thiol reductant ABC exporter subunit CydD n=1 Tax=Sphingomonas echinoides TaxID=59803 RepID=UPI002413B472|nr:thiol reductant ABC exporter subunit CydD [Sphingomonas echinoides]
MSGTALTVPPPPRLLATFKSQVSRLPLLLLLIDTAGAIGFAGGLAGAVAALAAGSTQVAGWIALMLGAGVVRGAATMLSVRAGARDAAGVKAGLRRDVVSALFRPLAGQGTTGAILASAVDEVEMVDGYIARFLPARQAATIAPIVVGAAVALASPVAALILIGTLFPFIAAMVLAGGAAAAESRHQFDALAQLSVRFADRVRALPVIRAFGAERRETDGIADAADAVARRTMRVLRVAFLSSASLEFFAALSVALVAVYAGFNVLGLLPAFVPEHLTLGRAFFVLALAPEFYAPMRRLAAAYHDRQAAETATTRLDAVIAGQAPPAAAWTYAGDAPPRLTFDAITLRYPGMDVAAVSDFSLDIAPGEIVALVGRSGCGKSSLLHYVLGLVPAAAGSLAIDGIVLPPRANLAPHTAWSGQTPLLLTGTIADNIAVSDPTAARWRIEDAAIRAGLAPALATRADGIDTLLDATGSGLSGGERRRIGLARAILKPAPVLLLDEPTAHLNSAAEAALIATIRYACIGRTVLIATHSPALAAMADRIIPMDRA